MTAVNLAKMLNTEATRRKIGGENRLFNDQWIFKYCFFIVDTCKGILICLLCREPLSVMKEFNR